VSGQGSLGSAECDLVIWAYEPGYLKGNVSSGLLSRYVGVEVLNLLSLFKLWLKIPRIPSFESSYDVHNLFRPLSDSFKITTTIRIKEKS
jgi:hypothetical protein